MRFLMLAVVLFFAGCQTAQECPKHECPVIEKAPSEEACKEYSDRNAISVITQLDQCKKDLEAKPAMVKKAKKKK